VPKTALQRDLVTAALAALILISGIVGYLICDVYDAWWKPSGYPGRMVYGDASKRTGREVCIRNSKEKICAVVYRGPLPRDGAPVRGWLVQFPAKDTDFPPAAHLWAFVTTISNDNRATGD
jgi:hypothetical protein